MKPYGAGPAITIGGSASPATSDPEVKKLLREKDAIIERMKKEREQERAQITKVC